MCVSSGLLAACYASTPGGDLHGGAASDGGVGADAMPDAHDAHETDDDARLTRRRFFAERRRVRCEYFVRCERRDSRQKICHPSTIDAWELHRAGGVLTGRLVFDPVAARACLDEMADAILTCESQMTGFWDGIADYTGISEACEAVFVGATPEGEVCNPDVGECAGGIPCVRIPDTMEWRCLRPQMSVLGGPCVTTIDCADGFERARCDDGICEPLGSAGDACDLRAWNCAPDLICADGVCVAREPRGEGEECVSFSSCEDPWVCVGGRCGEGVGEGASCDDGVECERALECALDGAAWTCRSNDGFDVGDACWVGEDRFGSTCRGPLHCSHITWIHGYRLGQGLCVHGASAGGACDATSPCARGNVCVEGICERAALPLEACAVDEVCPPQHRCADGTCRPLSGPGDPCTWSEGCIKGRCEMGVCCLVPDGAHCVEDPRGGDYDDCAGTCFGDGRCGSPPFECVGCDSCWPTLDECVPTCSP
jgi:hypothetical protein